MGSRRKVIFVKQILLRSDPFSFLRHRKTAFTLIELLLVIVLMAIFAGVALPNLPKQISAIQIEQTAKNMSYLMCYVQSLAVVHQREYRFCFSSDHLKYWIEEGPAETSGVPQASSDKDDRFQKIKGEKGKIFSVPSGIAADIENDVIGFYPDGSIDRIRIVLQNKDQKKIIISSQERRGQVDVFSPAE